jgi:hypothetical protein
LRRQRCTGRQIAVETGLSTATVCCILQRLGLNMPSALEPPNQCVAHKRQYPGELIHIDIKIIRKIQSHRITSDRTGQSNARGIGWEFVHVCIDDVSRFAFRGS